MSDPRDVIADFMLQGHIAYHDGQGRWSDNERAALLIEDLKREGVVVTAASAIEALEARAVAAETQVAARDKIIDQIRANHAEEAREWEYQRENYIRDVTRVVEAAGFAMDDAPAAIAERIARKRREHAALRAEVLEVLGGVREAGSVFEDESWSDTDEVDVMTQDGGYLLGTITVRVFRRAAALAARLARPEGNVRDAEVAQRQAEREDDADE